MYKPSDASNPQYPVFRKLNGMIIPFLGLKGLAAIAATLALGALLFAATGGIVHDVEVGVPASDMQLEREGLRAERAAVQLEEAQARLAPYQAEGGAARDDLTAEERGAYQEAKAAASAAEAALAVYGPDQRAALSAAAAADGVAADTTDEELQSMVAATRIESRPVVDDLLRFAALVFAPTVIAVVVVFESDGTSVASLVADRWAFSRKQKTYYYSRMD